MSIQPRTESLSKFEVIAFILSIVSFVQLTVQLPEAEVLQQDALLSSGIESIRIEISPLGSSLKFSFEKNETFSNSGNF